MQIKISKHLKQQGMRIFSQESRNDKAIGKGLWRYYVYYAFKRVTKKKIHSIIIQKIKKSKLIAIN